MAQSNCIKSCQGLTTNCMIKSLPMTHCLFPAIPESETCLFLVPWSAHWVEIDSQVCSQRGTSRTLRVWDPPSGGLLGPSLEMPAPKTTGFGAPLQVSLTEPSSADLRSEVSGSCHHLWQKEQMKLFPSNPSAGLCWKPLPARNLTEAGKTRFMPQEQGRSRINSS